jgi:AraC-like DNA-binding protein
MISSAKKEELKKNLRTQLEKMIAKTNQHSSTSNLSVSEEYLQALNLRLENLFTVNKIFRDPELTSKKLSDILNTNTTYLSYLINTNHKCSIPQFINRHRISEAKLMLSDSEYNKLKLESVAQSCGFNSKSSFNRSFKSEEGITPMEYKAFRQQNT